MCGPSLYVTHDREITEPVIGRVLAKGLVGDGLDGGIYVVIDGVDGRTHYVETGDDTKLEEVRRGHIAALEPVPIQAEPRAADLNIRDLVVEHGGVYWPSEHLEAARPRIERMKGDPDAFMRAHVRRLEALRRAGIVERIDADHWNIPQDITERGAAYDARNRGADFTQAMARLGSTGNWPRQTAHRWHKSGSAGKSLTQRIGVVKVSSIWDLPLAWTTVEFARPRICCSGSSKLRSPASAV